MRSNVYYAEPDGTITGYDMDDDAVWKRPLSGLFITVKGALAHPDCTVEATAIHRIKREAIYDAADVIANDWKTAGIEPSGYLTTIKLEG